MKLTLNIFIRCCTQFKVRCCLLHIGIHDNRVADYISRGDWTASEAVVEECGWPTVPINISEHMSSWEDELAIWAERHPILYYEDDRNEAVDRAIADVEYIDRHFNLSCQTQTQ